MATDTLLLSVLLISACILLFTRRWYNTKGHLPPGPTPFPVLGNLLDIPRASVGPAFAALTKKYGDIMYFTLFGQPMVVIGSINVAMDIMHNKSANFSGRPVSTVMKLVGLDSMFVFMQYGSLWRQHRRAFHLAFGVDRVAQYRPIQLNSARRLLSRLLTSSCTVEENINMYVIVTSNPIKELVEGSAMASVYGVDAITDDPDSEISKMIEILRKFTSPLILPGGYTLEMFPFLRHFPSWLPGMQLKRTVDEGRRAVRATFDKLDAMSAVATVEGRATDSMMTRVLANYSPDDSRAAATKELYRYIAATAVFGSSETTQALMEAFFLAMAMHPDSQKAAQAELDAVIGHERLPEFSDYDHLPYMRAFLKELIRWHIVTPMGLPHATVEDDEYNGYFIPAGTVISVNIWSLSRDPEEYPDPGAFKPERFLADKPPRDPGDYVFGFGRRICPGNHFATASLFIYCASVLHVFNIMPPNDEHGNPVAMEYRPQSDLVSHVEGYEYIIKPRSAKAQRLVADLML